MQSRPNTCFFITPIGDENTETRRRADRVLKHLITPALRQCGFLRDNIIRADEEPVPGRITARIEQHIQNDDLCIVDLTGLNANVMYEYGLRKGIGKPIIVIAQKDQKLPFDIKDELTIFYNDDNFDDFFRAQDRLEKTVVYWIEKGFVAAEGEGSVSEITRKLRSIEDKLDAVLSANKAASASTGFAADQNDEILRKLSPIQAFNYALRTRDVALGESLLDRLEQAVPKEKFIDAVVSQLALLGSERAGTRLRAEWPYIETIPKFKYQYEALACYISYCTSRDIEEENLAFVTEKAEALLEMAETDKDRAGVYNQMNRIYYGAYATAKQRDDDPKNYLNEAIVALEKATMLDKEDASYFYNLALCYSKKGEQKKALTAINRCLELDTKDDDHLALAYNLHKEENSARANDILDNLKKINPFRAELLT